MLQIAYETAIDVYSSIESNNSKKQWIIEELEDIYKKILDMFIHDVFGADNDKVT